MKGPAAEMAGPFDFCGLASADFELLTFLEPTFLLSFLNCALFKILLIESS